jgi:hypothetical protein
MTTRFLLKFCLILMFGAVVSACDGVVEPMYSYINVGKCKGGYTGDIYTPQGNISECLALLTTSVSLNVSHSTQTVTLIEEDLGFNKQPVIILISATKLKNCSIVDKSNFSCDGLERRGGEFLNTGAIGWRRLSSSKVCASVAKYWGNGWVNNANLDLHDNNWMYIVYSVVIVGILIFGILSL